MIASFDPLIIQPINQTVLISLGYDAVTM